MTENIQVLVRADGTSEFDCIGCGVHVYRYGGTNEPLCMICLYMPGWEQAPDGHLRRRKPRPINNNA